MYLSAIKSSHKETTLQSHLRLPLITIFLLPVALAFPSPVQIGEGENEVREISPREYYYVYGRHNTIPSTTSFQAPIFRDDQSSFVHTKQRISPSLANYNAVILLQEPVKPVAPAETLYLTPKFRGEDTKSLFNGLLYSLLKPKAKPSRILKKRSQFFMDGKLPPGSYVNPEMSQKKAPFNHRYCFFNVVACF